MTDRIRALVELTMSGKMFPHTVKVAYDGTDDNENMRAFLLHQEPVLTPYSRLTGMFYFDGSVSGDAFRRTGHKHTQEVLARHYCKTVDRLSTMEWQHATADYALLMNNGLAGLAEKIDESLKTHDKPEEISFLKGMKYDAESLVLWAHRCADKARALRETLSDEGARKNLETLADALMRVPEHKPESFFEAVLCIYVTFGADPDSIGPLDRVLSPFYQKDIAAGTLTRDEAKELLQELFLMLQAKTPVTSRNFTRGGESHFCIGGYLSDGRDAFDETSYLIAESLMEIPTYAPQITMRWTKKTPHEAFRFMMDCERRDPFKRIAFTNDEKRVKCYTELCGFPYERAVSYTTVGCNEPAMTGAITGSNSKGNILRCMDLLFHQKAEFIEDARDFDEFYAIFEDVMRADLYEIFHYDDYYNLERAKDVNTISSLLFNDCAENARSLTQGGGNCVIAAPMLLGIPNLIDSLIVVKQFVFEEKLLSMRELIDAVQANWKGYEALRTRMLKTGRFFGNDDELSNGVARRLYHSFYLAMKGRKNAFGYQWLIGDILGYNEHHHWFGQQTLATPDGRFDGDDLKFGLGQSEGRDKNGLSALLNAIAQTDPDGIGCGSTATNVMLDEQLVKNDEAFEKTVRLFETYFQNGGVHFQLTYVSREDLLKAKEKPEDYQSLRVRVTGFSECFVKLQDSIQDDVIRRTPHRE